VSSLPCTDACRRRQCGTTRRISPLERISGASHLRATRLFSRVPLSMSMFNPTANVSAGFKKKGKERFSQTRMRYSVCDSASITEKTEAGLLSSPNQCAIKLSASGCAPDTKSSPPASLPAWQ